MKLQSFLDNLLFIAVITIIMALVYATVQQSYRTAANDPQIQIAQDISAKVRQGKSIEDIFQTDTIDVANSLSTFVAVYNSSGLAIKSTGYLNGKLPQPPVGIFDVAKKNGEHRITWQPQNNVRMAMVIVYTNALPLQFIAAGRSLREVEEREYALRKMVFTAWLMCVAIIAITVLLKQYFKLKFRPTEIWRE